MRPAASPLLHSHDKVFSAAIRCAYPLVVVEVWPPCCEAAFSIFGDLFVLVFDLLFGSRLLAGCCRVRSVSGCWSLLVASFPDRLWGGFGKSPAWTRTTGTLSGVHAGALLPPLISPMLLGYFLCYRCCSPLLHHVVAELNVDMLLPLCISG